MGRSIKFASKAYNSYEVVGVLWGFMLSFPVCQAVYRLHIKNTIAIDAEVLPQQGAVLMFHLVSGHCKNLANSKIFDIPKK